MQTFKNIILIFSIILYFNSSLAQHKSKPIPKEIKEINNFYEGFKNQKDYHQFKDTVSEKHLKYIAKILYEANEKDAINVRKQYEYEVKKSDSLSHKHLSTFGFPGATKGMIEKEIKEKFSNTIYALTTTAYFLKIKVKSFGSTKIKPTPNSNIEFGTVDVHGIIEDVIKGDNHFSIGDNIIFYYMAFWRKYTNKNFQEGKSYFVPLNVAEGEGKKYDWLALVTLDDEQKLPAEKFDYNLSYGCFQIDNGYLIDSNNYFGYGEKIFWTDFRNNLTQQINLIKSW